jgi:hypothetical protein
LPYVLALHRRRRDGEQFMEFRGFRQVIAASAFGAFSAKRRPTRCGRRRAVEIGGAV